ncbi:MAG TPA: hypothetical protein VLA89_14035 [Gemmatimonadales bacterium]|nr:hypothetical protein [Gemmatimonadales bacterium]
MTHELMPGQELYDVIRLSTSDADYLFPVAGPVRVQNIGSFSRKFNIGDTTRDSDDLLSTYVTLSNMTGGGQKLEMNEAADTSRFWYSTLRTTESNYLSLNRETVTVTGTYPLGDFKANDRFYYANGLDIYEWDETTDTGSDTGDNLTSTPVNVGVSFKGTGTEGFFIPLGSSGIDKYAGGVITNITDCDAMALYQYGTKLYALDLNGTLFSSTDGATFAEEGIDANIDGSEDGKHLAIFYNQANKKVLHAITNRAVYAYDEDTEKFYEIFDFPPHPGNGKGCDHFRSALYVASGMMVYAYAGGTIGEVGPTRDDGLPAAYRGEIVDLRKGHNALYALIAGSADVADAPANIMQEQVIQDASITFAGSTAVASVMAWTELGWHTIWVSTGSGTAPNRILVSGAQNGYRLWWGANGSLYTQELEADFHNPLQGLEAGIDRFTTTGYIETPWFDAAMEGFHKIGSHVEVSLERASASTPVIVKCMKDHESGWTQIHDPLTAKGRHVIPLGLDDEDFSRGLHFEKIRFRVEFTGTATDSPLLRHLALYFIKEPKESHSWQIQIVFPDEPDPALGWNDSLQIKETLDALLESEQFLSMTHLRETWRVRVSAVPNGIDETGQEVYAGSRLISLVECKLPESDIEEAS